MALAGIARASQILLLQTFVTVGLSAPVNGEHIGPLTILTAIAVVVIVALGQRARTGAKSRIK